MYMYPMSGVTRVQKLSIYDMRVCHCGRWEVVAAHHRVHDYAYCHLQANCLESGISSVPLRSIMSMGNLYLYLLDHIGHEF